MDAKYGMANHLDSIRREANITVADFCDGICSERQYSRYLNGSQQIRQEKLNAFCERLGLSPQGFYRSYYLDESRDYKMVVELFETLYSYDLPRIKLKLDELEKYNFTYHYAERLYKFCIYRYQYMSKQVPMSHSLAQYSELIDYPNMMNKKHVTFIDVVTLIEIARTAGLAKKDITPLEFLYDILVKEDKMYVSSDEAYMLPTIYYIVAQFYGSLGNHDKSIMICDKGIDYHHKIRSNDTLASLYYFRSLGYFSKGNKEEAFKSARKCLYTHISKGDMRRYKITCELLQKDFGVDPITYFNIDKDTEF